MPLKLVDREPLRGQGKGAKRLRQPALAGLFGAPDAHQKSAKGRRVGAGLAQQKPSAATLQRAPDPLPLIRPKATYTGVTV